jgi:hypothetical protein
MDNQHDNEHMITPQAPEAAATEERAGDEDVAGYQMGTPAAILWQIAPRVAILKTLPDPGPEQWGKGQSFNQGMH